MRHRLPSAEGARGAWSCGVPRGLGRPTALGMMLGAIVTLAAQQLLGDDNEGMPTNLRSAANGHVGGRLSSRRDLGDRVERVSRLDQPHAAELTGEDTGTFDQNDRLLAEVAEVLGRWPPAHLAPTHPDHTSPPPSLPRS